MADVDAETAAPASTARGGPVGNRLALAGVVLYLLEWVAIIGSAPPGPFGPGTSHHSIYSDYASHAGRATLAAAWFAVVLVGRILFVSGVKASLRDRPRAGPLLDLALGAMAVSVVLEVVAYAVVAGTARLAASGAGTGLVVGLDSAAFWVDLLIWGPVGVSVLATGVAMLRSGLFASWLSWLGIVAGVAGIVGCLVAGATVDASGSGAADAATSLPALAIWVWMVATGVVLWRRAAAADD
jgi:hypothetical protein